ncbi:MAG: amino acid permease [Gammaproteobacteria bacterium]|nr:amino acid permease [Gammaproteobacteria bacterium]
MNLFRTKSVGSETTENSSLKRCLNAFDLTLLGVGAIIGAGVFVLTGIAAATKAGPAICISYIIAGCASMFAALSYAELATAIGGCGSAYNYSYVVFGEIIAWVIGWDLLLEYALSVSTVAIGWSGYVNDALESLNIHLPLMFLRNPFEGGIVNLPAVLIILCLASLLCIGVKQTARFNAIIVFIKLLTIALFIGFAINNVNTANWHVFFPFGFSGVMQGAALVFFAYIGFDALSTAAEETINPQRNIPIGIISSVILCTTIYIVVSALLTGIVPYTTLNVKSPVADAMLHIGYPVVAGFISAGAIAGLTTVMLVMYYGLTRVCYAISRDGLLPPLFAKTNPKTQTPIVIILLSGIVIAAIAGFVPIGQAAELVNIGTLSAFILVCGGVIVLRYKQPNLPRPFRLPWNPVIPGLGVLFCAYLIINLAPITLWFFLFWMIVGLVVYFSYSLKHSILHKMHQ